MTKIETMTKTERKTKVKNIIFTISKLRVMLDKKETELKKIQSICKHEDFIYHSRPCAEADSWNECKICKATF